MQLVVDKIAKAFGIHEIFKNVSFMIEQGEHVGLVGVNGSGKTTLLRCLLQPDWIDAGAIKFEPGISVGYVQQGFTEIHGTIWEFMSEACPEITAMRKKLAELEQAANGRSGEALDNCLDEYARVTKRYEFIDGYNFENRIKRVLIGLGYTEEWWSHEANNLSGGQKTRLMLAAALVRNPDFMILDEPTNHLDIIMTQWLEKYLQEFNDEYENNVRQGNGAENVGCIIMEVDTGNVLAMASYPFYDLNNPRDPSRLIGMRQVNRKGNKTKGEATEEDVYALMELEKAAWEKQNASLNSGSTDTTSSDSAEGAEESDGDASQENREEAAADTENSSPDTYPDSDEAYENEEDLEDWEIEDSSEENSDDISSFMQPTEAIKAKADLLAQKNISEESLAAMDDALLYQNFDALWKNFCINDTYEPGSVAKPFTVAAAIDSGAITGNEGYNCEGKLHVGDHDIKCHNVYGDGYLTVQQAIERSCNVALMHIANATGKQQFLRYQRNFGFGLKTNIDLAGESRTASLVYNVDTMGPTDLATNSFGQGFNTTMIQMITGFCSLINGGNLYEPHMVSKIMTSDGATIQNIEPRIMKQTVSPTTSEKIIEYCNTVVTGEYGTGKTARPAGYMIGGKTGTAQTLPRGNGEYVVSFMGYAPADDPQIAIYVVVDRPNRYGQDDAKFATRIVRNILTEVLPYLHIYMTEELSEKEIKELEEKQLQDTIIMQQHAAELTGETIPEEENGGASGGDNAGNGEAPGEDNSENGENTENGTGEEEPEEERLERNEPWKDFPIDPETGYAKDPNTGYLVDTETGAVVAGLDEIPSETSSDAGSEEPSAEKQE